MNFSAKRSMKTGARISALALCIVALCAATGSSAARPAGGGDEKSFTIAIKDFAFSPREITIPAGAKVVWRNDDEEPHKVAETNTAFTSQPLDTGGEFSYQFDTPGTYKYFCTLHPHMTGTIVVQSQ
jgi:plastocyanin